MNTQCARLRVEAATHLGVKTQPVLAANRRANVRLERVCVAGKHDISTLPAQTRRTCCSCCACVANPRCAVACATALVDSTHASGDGDRSIWCLLCAFTASRVLMWSQPASSDKRSEADGPRTNVGSSPPQCTLTVEAPLRVSDGWSTMRVSTRPARKGSTHMRGMVSAARCVAWRLVFHPPNAPRRTANDRTANCDGANSCVRLGRRACKCHTSTTTR